VAASKQIPPCIPNFGLPCLSFRPFAPIVYNGEPFRRASGRNEPWNVKIKNRKLAHKFIGESRAVYSS
jgi:hypothetical protein